MGNTCAGVSSRAVCWERGRGGVYHCSKRKGRQEGGIKPVGEATTSSIFAAENRRTEEISYSNVLIVAPLHLYHTCA